MTYDDSRIDEVRVSAASACSARSRLSTLVVREEVFWPFLISSPASRPSDFSLPWINNGHVKHEEQNIQRIHTNDGTIEKHM